ncbi:response regulator [Bacteroidales bacterium OttesenSCG-928-K22]|nr:response regulator [Bacteroidales bacterium OttesenSCG-928-K22]
MHKILIVDDEQPARKFIANLVTFYLPDSKITEADHPKKALAYFQNNNFDILFLDVVMPNITGLELLEQIKMMGKEPFTVIISAYNKFDYAVKGIDLGVAKYLVKPLHKDKICEAVDLYLMKVNKDTIEFKAPNEVIRVEFNQILALETMKRNRVNIYTSSSVITNVSGTLSQLKKRLPSWFCYIRRNCILNSHAITGYNLKSNEITVNGKDEKIVFKASRERMAKIYSEYLKVKI